MSSKMCEENENAPIITQETMKLLCEGFSASYESSLGNTKQQLSELLQTQNALMDELHEENLKVSWTQNSVQLQKMFDVISASHSKLKRLKNDMKHLHDRNVKLKKRVQRIQQYKRKLDSILQSSNK